MQPQLKCSTFVFVKYRDLFGTSTALSTLIDHGIELSEHLLRYVLALLHFIDSETEGWEG